MLHYCSEIVSAYSCSQLKKVTIKFQDGRRNYQLKMAVKNNQICPFWRKFGLNSLGMSQIVALLFRNFITLLLFTIRNSYNQISRWPPKLSTRNGFKNHQTCLFWLKFDLECLGMSQNVALFFRNCISLLFFHN